MRIFTLDKNYSVVCDTKDTRNGFKHEATLLSNGYEREKTKICYLNRAWERFTYEIVLRKLIDVYFEGKEKEKYKQIINTFN